jgi:hypothetical protein
MVLANVLIACNISRAQTERTLETSIENATTIVIGRLEQYLAEPESMDRMVQEQARSSGGLSGNPAAIVMMTVQVRGTYVYSILGTLKGKAPQTLVVRWPRITSGRMGSSANSMRLKGVYLLILNSSGETFSPAGPLPMPISRTAKLPDAENPKINPADEVSRILIESLSDPVTRPAVATMLGESTNPKALEAMRAFADDPDDTLRAAALACMAVNQDVTAIPKIAGWKFSNPNVSGNGNLSLFAKYKTPAAIPYFNELLLDQRSEYIRLNAAQALRQLPLDQSTVPYWMKALHDDERQTIVSYAAYNSLHRMFPELGPPGNVAEFRANREAEIKALDDWWKARHSNDTQPN